MSYYWKLSTVKSCDASRVQKPQKEFPWKPPYVEYYNFMSEVAKSMWWRWPDLDEDLDVDKDLDFSIVDVRIEFIHNL